MEAENPYRSSNQTEPASDRISITNFNQAGGPLVVALIIGPLLIAGLIWLMANGRIRDATPEGRIAILTAAIIAELVALTYAVRVPVLWVELGPTLRYGSLAFVNEVEWGSVQRVWFDRADEWMQLGPIPITLRENQSLIIRINDYKDLQVLVPRAKLELVRAILSRHPRFKDGPFDEDTVNSAAVEDDLVD